MAENDLSYKKIHLSLECKNVQIKPSFNIAGGVVTSFMKIKIEEYPLHSIIGNLIEEFGEEKLIEIIKKLNQ